MSYQPLSFQYENADYRFTMKTLRGKVVTLKSDFHNTVSDWIRATCKGRWDHRLGKGETIFVHKMIKPTDTWIAYYAFEDKADAALFKMFWLEDLTEGWHFSDF